MREAVLAAWADHQEATEYGATGIALAIMEALEWVVLQRSVKGTGFDYWLGPKLADPISEHSLFQSVTALEVSGILDDRDGLQARLSKKEKQVAWGSERSTSRANRILPAWIIVVGFARPEVLGRVTTMNFPTDRIPQAFTNAAKRHNEAIALADRAFSTMQSDKRSALFKQAFHLERESALLVKRLEPTRSILRRSAAWLALNCGEHQAASDLARDALAGAPPNLIQTQLFALIQALPRPLT